MEKRSKAKLSLDECKQSALKFFQSQRQLKRIQSDFENEKKQFYSDMEDYFKCNEIKSKLFLDGDEFVDKGLVVTRVQSSKVIFDVKKLERALGKDVSKDVIIKRYEIADMKGLITYLRECNVDPKIFKSFLCVSKQVDTAALDRLEELGKISLKQVEDCYTINRSNPYFQVSVSKEKGDEK